MGLGLRLEKGGGGEDLLRSIGVLRIFCWICWRGLRDCLVPRVQPLALPLRLQLLQRQQVGDQQRSQPSQQSRHTQQQDYKTLQAIQHHP